MGADIHVFVEFNNTTSDSIKWSCGDVFFYNRLSGYKYPFARLGAYEGRNSELFDILQNEVPQYGTPIEEPSDIFLEEWNSYKDGRYGINFITVGELVDFYREIEFKNIFIDKGGLKFDEKAYVLYPFVIDVLNRCLSLERAGVTPSVLLTNLLGKRKTLSRTIGGRYYRVLYFFDR